MISKSVEYALEKLRLTTRSRLNQLQSECAPYLANEFITIEEDDYSYSKEGIQSRINVLERFRVFKIDGLKYVPHPNKKHNCYHRDMLLNMVNDNIIYPFLLFIDKQLIPWSRIELVRDYTCTYLLIYGYDKQEPLTDFDIIEFPCRVRYGEDDNVLPPPDRSLGLYFDSDGLLTMGDDISVRFEVIDENIYGEIKTISEDHPEFEIDAGLGHRATYMSIIPFKNNIVYSEGIDELTYRGWNIYANLKAEDYSSYSYLVFYYTRANKESSHPYRQCIAYEYNKNKILDNTRIPIKYLEDLFNLSNFDFEYDRNKDFNTNAREALDYIMNYDANLLDFAYKDVATVFSESYTGQYLLDRAAANRGIMVMSSKRHGNFDCKIMMFVNGELYRFTDRILYINNLIYIPVIEIKSKDKIEILFFTDACNTTNTIVVEKNVPCYVSYNIDDISLYSEDKHGLVYDVFDIDPDGRTQMEVEFTYTATDEKNKYLIIFEDEYWYGKTLTIASNNQMRHCAFSSGDINEGDNGDYYFLLPTDFNFCHKKSHYVVLLNGRMLTDQNFTITAPSRTRPFDKIYLYVTTHLEYGDTLDIYYLPYASHDSIWIDELDVSGDIVVDTSKINVPLSTDNYFVFVDGRKVDPGDIINISRTKMRIKTSYDSLHNVLFVNYNPSIPELQEAFNATASDEWSRYIDSLKPYDLNSLLNNITDITSSKNTDYTEVMYPLSTIVSDIVFDFYMKRAGLQSNDVFVYDFENDAIGELGPNTGIDALNTTDSTRIDKMHQYWYNHPDKDLRGMDWYDSPVDED